ncbi:exodeoxyribonuclease III [Salininema proteolyticum]|uniref:Exodeoxyribonuclease III n=1 Tax=Salininema proteolyticum TaxID=1607685 RepID=A0ABV8U420_9ACTN
MTTTIATANVNGVRAASKKGIVEWLADTDADLVLLQEVRAERDQIPAAALESGGWHWHTAPSRVAKGRAGVALLTREDDVEARVGFQSDEFDTAGRYIEIDHGPVTVGSLYLPSGETGTPRQEEKYRFLDEFGAYLRAKKKEVEAEGRHFVVGGDWNIAPKEADLKNWKNNKKTSGFLPEERAWVEALKTEAGFTDPFRELHPDQDGPYSWWSYRGKAFDNDAGWRIDYQLATPGLGAKALSARVDRAESYDTRWSDHAPVVIAYDI